MAAELLEASPSQTLNLTEIQLEAIEAAPWLEHIKRRVQHYGYAFDYATRHIDPRRPLGDLPPWANLLVDTLLAQGNLTLTSP